MKIGILGCGQAGSRIALALNSIAPEVGLIAGEPNQSSAIFDPSSPFHVKFVSKHIEDGEFFSNSFDALVVSPDPISLFDRVGVEFKQDKMPFIAGLDSKTPMLMERPLGFNNDDPKLFIEFTKQENVSVMAYHFRLPLANFLSKHTPKRLLIDASLNCGLIKKPWRRDFRNITLPIHFGDQFLSVIDRAVQSVEVISASHDIENVDSVSFDTNWEISLTSINIPSIRIHLDQYVGMDEFRFEDDVIRAFGSDYSASISPSSFEVRRGDGTIEQYRYDLSTAMSDHVAGISKLKSYMIEVEGYPDVEQTEGLSRAIFESVLDWYNTMIGKAIISSHALKGMGVEHAKRSMALSQAVVSAAKTPPTRN